MKTFEIQTGGGMGTVRARNAKQLAAGIRKYSDARPDLFNVWTLSVGTLAGSKRVAAARGVENLDTLCEEWIRAA